MWLVGEESGYVKDTDTEQMRALFPRARPVVVKGVGHWVHSEAPDVVTETLRRAQARRDEALAVFRAEGGEALLGVRSAA